MSSIEQMRARAKARARQERKHTRQDDPRVASALSRFENPEAAGDGYVDTRGFVRQTDEFNRVFALPRTRWDLRDDLDDLCHRLTEHLRTFRGTMKLRPIQAVLLEALVEYGGAFGSIGVGEGKTLPSYVAGTLMDADRTAVLVPSKLREKTRRDFADLSEHFIGPRSIRVFGYEELGVVSGANKLSDYAPQVVVGDEIHALKNLDAARTRRVVRYLRDNPDVAFMPMSGTPITRSIMDFYHHLALALGPARMPLPAIRSEARQWARAVDEKTTIRARPGALRLLTKEKPTLTNIRNAVESRIHKTPGVLRTFNTTVDAAIHIDFFDPPVCAKVKGLMNRLVKNRIAPNGDEALPIDVYRHIRTLACGFWYRWDPAPPDEWMDARREWKRCVRDLLDQQIEGLDSELQIANAADRGEVETYGTLDMWRAVRQTYKPNVVAEWEDTRWIIDLEKRIVAPTLVWVEHQATGDMLSRSTGWAYYGAQGKDAKGNDVMDADPSDSIILSIAANAEGRNLQAWADNLVVTPPGSGKTWEQLLGRTHRPGQKADEIHVDIMLGHPALFEAFAQAMADARFIHHTTGQPQKLLLADCTRKV